MKITSNLLMTITTLAPLIALGASRKASAAHAYLVYIGTYTANGTSNTGSKGIYVYRWDAAAGRLTAASVAAESVNPSFLAVDPSHRYLYAVNEVDNFGGANSGGLSAFALDRKTGKLKFLNEAATRGGAPCYVAFDKTGKYAAVANYGGGSIAIFPVLADGRIGKSSAFIQNSGSSVDRARQEAPHAHMIDVSPDNRFVLAADLGLDELLVFRFDASHGTLTSDQPAFAKVNPGSGPRHFAFHPNGRWVYLASEMKSTVTAFTYDAATGALHSFQTISALPKDFAGSSTAAEIAVHPSGKFVYSSNRGHDSIAVFAIDAHRGTLSAVEYAPTGGKEPRNFAVDPTGRYLLAADQNSNRVVVFRIDGETGRLTSTGATIDVPSPVAITFVPAE